MPNIDVSTIEGFDAMTPEQKVEALLKVEIPEKIDMTQYVTKDTSNKLASENKNLKDQLKARMDDDERAKSEAEQAMKDLQEKYTVLLRESTISKNTASYMAMPGYDEKLAKEAAEALADNNTAKLFEIQQKAAEAAAKQIKDELTRKDPRYDGPGGGDTNEVPENIKLAQELGKLRHQSQSASDDIMKHYMK